MNEEHPMRARLDVVLERTGMSYEEAVTAALQGWICEEEASYARRPRELTAADLTAELYKELAAYGLFEVAYTFEGDIRILHSHPFLGALFVSNDAETTTALNAWGPW